MLIRCMYLYILNVCVYYSICLYLYYMFISSYFFNVCFYLSIIYLYTCVFMYNFSILYLFMYVWHTNYLSSQVQTYVCDFYWMCRCFYEPMYILYICSTQICPDKAIYFYVYMNTNIDAFIIKWEKMYTWYAHFSLPFLYMNFRL